MTLNPVYTTGDQVMEAIMRHQNVLPDEAKERTIELLEKCVSQSQKLEYTCIHEMSGGQKQRVMIAMALVQSKTLIADEPTIALM